MFALSYVRNGGLLRAACAHIASRSEESGWCRLFGWRTLLQFAASITLQLPDAAIRSVKLDLEFCRFPGGEDGKVSIGKEDPPGSLPAYNILFPEDVNRHAESGSRHTLEIKAPNSNQSRQGRIDNRQDVRREPKPDHRESQGPTYAALDLGTNNCRLLVARPSRRGFKVVDAFSRIIRLGEGVTQTGALSEAAIARTMQALQVCAAKMARNKVTRSRLVATEACRIAQNSDDFLERVRANLGLEIEILSHEDEARLAVTGCSSLIDPGAELVLVFDIGGGCSELIWLDLAGRPEVTSRSLADRVDIQKTIRAWTSLPVGVVTLAERTGGGYIGPEQFDGLVQYVLKLILPFEARAGLADELKVRPMHLLGTSGTVTTVAGVHLGLPSYDRNRVDGCWITGSDVRRVTARLLAASHQERIAEPCIGRERADLVLAGCAILEALLRVWPCERLRVADRGLREGILASLMRDDGPSQRIMSRP